MALTLTVQGEGGGRWDVDVPAAGSHAREHFDQKVANGQLLVLVDDEPLSATAAAELLAEQGGTPPADLRKVRGGPTPEPAAEPVVAEEPPMAGAGSGRDAWAAYAATKGVDVDGMNRAEIIAALAEQGGTPPADS